MCHVPVHVLYVLGLLQHFAVKVVPVQVGGHRLVMESISLTHAFSAALLESGTNLGPLPNEVKHQL